MSVLDTEVRTITCDGKDCSKTVTFAKSQAQQTFATPGNEWMKTTRIVQSPDGRTMVYCGDICEISGVEAGKHNLPEEKKIIVDPNQAAVNAAAQAAAQATQATAALKAGQPVTL